MIPACPDVIDDDVPGQPEQPAPEGDAPQLVARQGFQGLDEDELRQVLRVARAADAGRDVAEDRPVVVVEQGSEGFRVSLLRRCHEALDRLVVEGHNDAVVPALGSGCYVNGPIGKGTSIREPPRRKASASKPALAT